MDPEQIPIRDLHLPVDIGWWPLAPGWWVLIALVSAGVIWALCRQYVRWRADRARRLALKQLAAIEREYSDTRDAVTIAGLLSELLRRTFLAYAPRSAMAGLTGDRWLEYLNEGLDEAIFTRGAGRRLASLPYERPSGEQQDDVPALIEAVRRRLQTPLVGGRR